jgi:hypothetical protein
MKKKKIITGVMVSIVVSVWGYNIIGISGVFNDQGEELEEYESGQLQRKNLSQPHVQVDLSLNYQDPFLKSMQTHSHHEWNNSVNVPASGKDLAKTRKKVDSAPPKKEDKAVNPTRITYHGFIKNRNDSTQKIAVIRVDQAEVLLKIGDTINEMTLSEVKKGSVIFLHTKGDRVSIRKE